MKGHDSKSLMINASMTNALILLRGKPEPGGLSPPETGFFIGEQNLDESITDQISAIYTYLNNVILAINHNASMLNGIAGSVKASVDGRQIMASLRQIDDLSEESEVDSSLKPLKQRLAELTKAADQQAARIGSTDEALGKIDSRMTDLDISKATFSSIDAKILEYDNKASKKTNDLERKLYEKVNEVKTKSDDLVSNMIEKVSRVEKDLAWKINDYGDLLKLRPTEASIEANLKSLAEKLRAEMEEMFSNKLAEQRFSQVNTSTDSTNRGSTSLNEIFEKINHFENQ